MAIEEQANNAIPTGGVTDVAENPNEVQVAGLGKTIVDIFEALLRPADDAADASKKITAEKPPPQTVANQVPTPIAEDAILTGKKTYGKTADYWAKRTLSPAGYSRWVEQNKQARKIVPEEGESIESLANKSVDEVDAKTPIDDRNVLKDADAGDGVLRIKSVIRKDNKGGIDFNFEKLETSDDVLDLIDAVSKIYKNPTEAAKRGVVTNKETMANASDLLADELGLTKKLFKQGRGAVMNAEEMLAVRQLIIKSAARLNRLAKRIETGQHSPEDLLAFRKQLAIHAGIQMKAKAAQTEIARALQAFNIPAGQRAPELKAETVQKLLKESGGADLAIKLAKGYRSAIREGGRAAGNQYAFRGFWANKGRIFNEIYVNGLLSWTTTHLKNAIATPVFQIYQLPEELLAGVFGTIERGVRKSAGFARGADDGVFLGQAFARIYGWSKAWKEAWIVASKTLRTEAPASFGQKIDHAKYKAIDAETLGSNNFWSGTVDFLGKAIRLPGRGLQTADDFWKTIAQRGELHTQAYMAKRTSLRNGDDIATANDNAMMTLLDPRVVGDDVDAAANYATLTSDPGIIGKVTNAVQSTVLGRILLPFARVPTNAVIRVAERGPFAAINPKFYKEIITGSPAVRQKALARLTFTSGVMYMLSQYATEGRITGAYPKSDKQRKLLPPGWQPYSLVFRDQKNEKEWLDSEGDLLPLYDKYGVPNGPLKYIKYSGIEPVGAILGITADTVQRMHRTDDPIIRDNIGVAAALAAVEYMKELPFLQTIGDITRAFEYQDLDELTSGPLGNMIGILPLPYSNLQRTVSRSYGDNIRKKLGSDLEYYTVEDVEAMPIGPDGDYPYEYVGRLKGGAGEWFTKIVDGTWKLQTKDSLIFGSNEDDLAIQYDVLGNEKEVGVRFDIRPGEALWNLLTPFDIKRGEEPEEWQKELYRIGMPLVTKRRMLEGKIRLDERAMSDWSRLAKNEVMLRQPIIGKATFRDALENLIYSRAYSKYTLQEKINAVKRLEDDYYDEAVDLLFIVKNSEGEIKYPDLIQVYNDLIYVKDTLKKQQY